MSARDDTKHAVAWGKHLRHRFRSHTGVAWSCQGNACTASRKHEHTSASSRASAVEKNGNSRSPSANTTSSVAKFTVALINMVINNNSKIN